MLQSRPALRFVLLFILGILLANSIQVNPFIIFIIIIAIVTLSSLLKIKNESIVVDVFIQLAIILIGFLLHNIQKENYYSLKITSEINGENINVYGVIDSEPMYDGKRISFVVKSDSIIRTNKTIKINPRLLIVLYLSKDEKIEDTLEYAKRIQLQGRVEKFPFQRNIGEYDYGKYLELNNIHGIISVTGKINLKLIQYSENFSLHSFIFSIQKKLYKILDNLHNPRHSSFLKGIIFGYRDEIPVEIKQSFIDTGTIHILAVSGSNVAFVALMLFAVFGFFRLSKKIIVAITIIGLIIYMLITGSSPSVVRATIMAIVILVGTILERRTDVYNSISFAALILLMWNTNNLFDIGFQLSFSAVLSIVYFYPRLESLIKLIPEKYEEIKGIDTVLKLFAVSLAAQLGTIPFTAYYFNRISLSSLFANLLVVPISGLNTYIGFAEVAFYYLNTSISELYASVNDFLVWFLLGFVKRSASVPYAYLDFINMDKKEIVAYYLFILGVFNLNKQRVRNWLIIFLLVYCNYKIYSAIWNYSNPNLRISVIDVGQGDAILIKFPNYKHLMIDAGTSTPKYDTGEKTLVPYLKKQGISKLEYLLITHAHSDHIGGISSLLKVIPVDTIIINYDSERHQQIIKILEDAKIRGIAIKKVKRGEQIYVGTNSRTYILHPDTAKEINLNNNSIVLKILYGNNSVICVGDAETSVERKLVLRYGKFLKSDILKAGHHGSITSSSEEFIDIVMPKTVLISVGSKNKFNHPSPLVLNRYKSRSIEIHRTDVSGEIIYEGNGKVWEKKEWRN